MAENLSVLHCPCVMRHLLSLQAGGKRQAVQQGACGTLGQESYPQDATGVMQQPALLSDGNACAKRPRSLVRLSWDGLHEEPTVQTD